MVTDVAGLLRHKRVNIYGGFLKKVKECLSLSGPWKWKGVSVPHPFFKMGHHDMCLSKSNVDALDVVLNLLYKGVKEVKDLFDKITEKVSEWVSQKVLSKLGFLTIEQQNSLPLVLTQGAKCIKGTKDWSIKVKFTGKYKLQFQNIGGGEALYWQFGLGAGVVFGCKNETYRTYPFVDVSHPLVFMFTLSMSKTHDKDFKAEGSLTFGLKVYFTKFSSIDSGIKGDLSLSLQAGAKNLPLPCPRKLSVP